MNTRFCADCGVDITSRHGNSYLCLACAAARRHGRNTNPSPARREALRRASRKWYLANRVLRIRRVVCEDCGRTFTVAGPGFHHYCPKCAAFWRQERRGRQYRAWYRRNRPRELAKAKAKRLRRAA